MKAFGSVKTKRVVTQLPVSCPNCKKRGAVEAIIHNRRFQFFFIPAFPTGKIASTHCTNCGQVLVKREALDLIGDEFFTLKRKAKTPIWHFGWIIIIALAITCGVTYSILDERENMRFIEAPQAGDIYEIDKIFIGYTVYKVKSFTKDSVYFYPSLKSKFFKSDLRDDDLKEEESFDHENIMSFSKEELKDMRKSRMIIDINRED